MTFKSILSIFKLNDDQSDHKSDHKSTEEPILSLNSNSNSNSKRRMSRLKIAFGDVVVVNVKVGKRNNRVAMKCKGTVCYIGRPFRFGSVRYGIDLDKAYGDHNGTLYFNKKGKITFKKKKSKARKFFKCKPKHGIFVKQDKIVEIKRKLKTRITVGDYVDVAFRGHGVVQFVGQLENTKGDFTWYGIELDERKGRHSGKIHGVQYFDCKPQHGIHCRIVHGLKLIDKKPRRKQTGSAATISTPVPGSKAKKKKKKPKPAAEQSQTKSRNSRKKLMVASKKIRTTLAKQAPARLEMKKVESEKRGKRERHSHRILPKQTSTSRSEFLPNTNIGIGISSNMYSEMLNRQLSQSVGNDDTFSMNLDVDMASDPHIIGLGSTPVMPGLGPLKEDGQNAMLGQRLNLAPLRIPGKGMKSNMSTRILTDTQIDKRQFDNHFEYDEFKDEIGEGEFGVVYKCYRKLVTSTQRSSSTNDMRLHPTSTTISIGSENDETDSDEIEFPGDRTPFAGDMNGGEEMYNMDAFASDLNDSYTDSQSSSGSYSTSSNVLYPGEMYQNDLDRAKMADNLKEIYAVKKIKKAKFHHLQHRERTRFLDGLRKEIAVMRKIQRLKKVRGPESGAKYLIDLQDVFEDRNYIYIVTNYCKGDNLWKYVQKVGHLHSEHDEDFNVNCTEKELQRIMKQMLEGVRFLHEHDVAHLDLKPDNVVFDIDAIGQSNVQIIDFGISRMIPPLTKGKILVGTPNFVAPEVIKGYYDVKADIWSLGVIFFLLRYGFPPFFNNSQQINDFAHQNDDLYDKIQCGFDQTVRDPMVNGQLKLGAFFPKYYYVNGEPFEYNVSVEFRQLIGGMLTVQLQKRYTAAECIDHTYFQHLASERQLPRTVIDTFSKFNGMCQFRLLVAKVFAHRIEPAQQEKLKQLWMEFAEDADENDEKSGEFGGKKSAITLDRFKQVMQKYEHGYKDYQIDAIFESLDYDMTDTIDYEALTTAYSYQRLVATDERLWEVFAELDEDGDGQITKNEIKQQILKLHPIERDKSNVVCKKLVVVDEETRRNYEQGPNHTSSLSMQINEGIDSADWDDNGTIDYEEFLRSLHPEFNDCAVTPPPLDAEEDAFFKTEEQKVQNISTVYQQQKKLHEQQNEADANALKNQQKMMLMSGSTSNDNINPVHDVAQSLTYTTNTKGVVITDNDNDGANTYTTGVESRQTNLMQHVSH